MVAATNDERRAAAAAMNAGSKRQWTSERWQLTGRKEQGKRRENSSPAGAGKSN